MVNDYMILHYFKVKEYVSKGYLWKDEGLNGRRDFKATI